MVLFEIDLMKMLFPVKAEINVKEHSRYPSKTGRNNRLNEIYTQSALACSKLTIKTLEQSLKYV